MDDPPFFMRFLTPRSAPFLRAEIQHRIDGRQRDQTGEAKILVIHAGIAQVTQAARSAWVLVMRLALVLRANAGTQDGH